MERRCSADSITVIRALPLDRDSLRALGWGRGVAASLALRRIRLARLARFAKTNVDVDLNPVRTVFGRDSASLDQLHVTELFAAWIK